MKLWSEKYRPNKIEDLVLGEKTIECVKQWFSDYAEKKTDKRALLFTGPPGLGKTSFAHIILNELGYSIAEFNASDIRSKSQVQQNLYNLILLHDVDKHFKSGKPKGVGIIMDEVDGILGGIKGGLTQLLEFITPPAKKRKNSKNNILGNRWGPPMICICNTGNMKKTTLSSLTSTCLEIKFAEPSQAFIRKVIDRIAKQEHMSITEDAIKRIIVYSQKDFRRLTCLLQHLNDIYGKTITTKHVTASYQIFCKKEQDLYTTDSLKRIFNTMYDYQTVNNIYQKDKGKSPMVIHENYISAISLQKSTVINKIDNAISCIDSIINSDIIEKTMFNTQSWYLQPIQGMLCCYIPSYYMNCKPKIADINYIKWASVLGRNMHTQNDKNNAYDIALKLNTRFSYTIYDVQMLSEMIMYCLTNNYLNKGIGLMKKYNLEFTDIVKIIRCVKLTDYGTKWKAGGIDKASIRTLSTPKNAISECIKSKAFSLPVKLKTVTEIKKCAAPRKRKLVLIKKSKSKK